MDQQNNKNNEPRTEGYGIVKKILNTEENGHLSKYIGHKGKVTGWIIVGGVVKYNLMFDDGNSGYFIDQIEMEKIVE
jgi:hypothetical protein